MSDKTAEELATEANAPGTFSFVERLRGRNYAKDTVTVYLDEDLGYKLEALELEYRNDNTSDKRVKELEKEIAATLAQLEPSKYVFHCEGISNKRYGELEDAANEKFPIEYDETVHPFTGEKTKTIINSNERNEWFTSELWAAHVAKIVSGDSEDANVTPTVMTEFRDNAPLAALQRVGELINKLRMATDWIEYTEDEDFLVKP